MRDYGTGAWDGGDADCDHRSTDDEIDAACAAKSTLGGGKDTQRFSERSRRDRDVCGRCGARRVDSQIGLEASPDLYVERMVAVFREVRRVLRDDGTLWLNLGDSYASGPGGNLGATSTFQMPKGSRERSEHQIAVNGGGRAPIAPGLKPKDLVGIPWRVAFALQADGWYLRSDIIWSKPNPMPESVTDRPTKAHEYLFLLAKRPRYYFDQDAIREPSEVSPDSGWGKQILAGKMPVVHKTLKGRDSSDAGEGASWRGIHELGRNRRSVWTIATEPFPEAHFATFPQELVRPCILAGSREGDTVLDPFVGSGTTALVARKHGRRCIGIDLSAEYLAIAARRLQQLSLFAETVDA